jgi:site-specific DNA recombinase
MRRTPTSKTAVSYLRVASPAAYDQGPSVARQREACRRLADALGAEIVAEYVDVGTSGRTRERPGLRAMLRRLMRRDIDHVVMERIDRMSRSFALHAELTERIESRGATIVAFTPFIPFTPARRGGASGPTYPLGGGT